MAGEEAKQDMMFEVMCFSWGDVSLEEDFEKDGISVHVENACVTEELTAVSPLQVDAVIFSSNSKSMLKPEMTKYIARYEKTLLRVWLQNQPDDFDPSLIQREKLLVVHGQRRCQTFLKQFFSQMCAFLTKLISKLDLNDSKTVELEDLTVYAEEFGVEFTPQDLDFFLSEYQDEGDLFLTSRGILKWVKKGRPDCKVGTIIMKVIEAKNLLKGYSVVIKKVFLGDEIPAIKSHPLQGDIEITVGEKDFVPGAAAEAHIWSRNRLPHAHPADILGLSSVDSDFILSVTLRRNPDRSFTQIQDFMRNAIYKAECLIALGGPGEVETAITVDYRITETDATFYIIIDFSILASRDSSMRRDFKAFVSSLNELSDYEAHLTLESKTGLKDMLTRETDNFQDFVGMGVRIALKYALDSKLRDFLYSFPALQASFYPYFLIRELKLKSHFANLTDLPEDLQKLTRKAVPDQVSTLSGLLSLFGSVLNETFRQQAIEKQIELMLKTTTSLFDVTQVQLGMTFFKLAGEAVLHLQGLDEVMSMDIGEIRRKADEVKRAKQAQSHSASESGSENSLSRKPARKCSDSIGRRSSGSIIGEQVVGSGSEISDRGRERRGRAVLLKGSDSGSAKSPPRSRSISGSPPRRQDSGPVSPAAMRKASIGSEGSDDSVDSGLHVKIQVERKASIGGSSSSGSRGSLSD